MAVWTSSLAAANLALLSVFGEAATYTYNADPSLAAIAVRFIEQPPVEIVSSSAPLRSVMISMAASGLPGRPQKEDRITIGEDSYDVFSVDMKPGDADSVYLCLKKI